MNAILGCMNRIIIGPRLGLAIYAAVVVGYGLAAAAIISMVIQ